MPFPRIRFYIDLDIPRAIRFTAVGGAAGLLLVFLALVGYEAMRYADRGGTDWGIFFRVLFERLF